MKKKLLVTLLASVVALGGLVTPTFADTVPEHTDEIYVESGVTSEIQKDGIKEDRANIENALSNNNKFYSVASHTFSKFTFDQRLVNVEGKPDINFYEVTWGTSWHEEAVEVYLINPVLQTSDGDNVSYLDNDLIEGGEDLNLTEADKESFGTDGLYFAGVAFNKAVDTEEKAQKYTDYEANKLSQISSIKKRTFGDKDISKKDSDTLITGFNLPKNVKSAEGIVLVDITAKINSDRPDLASDDGFDLMYISAYKGVR